MLAQKLSNKSLMTPLELERNRKNISQFIKTHSFSIAASSSKAPISSSPLRSNSNNLNPKLCNLWWLQIKWCCLNNNNYSNNSNSSSSSSSNRCSCNKCSLSSYYNNNKWWWTKIKWTQTMEWWWESYHNSLFEDHGIYMNH
jgi:hypothetical protein